MKYTIALCLLFAVCALASCRPDISSAPPGGATDEPSTGSVQSASHYSTAPCFYEAVQGYGLRVASMWLGPFANPYNWYFYRIAYDRNNGEVYSIANQFVYNPWDPGWAGNSSCYNKSPLPDSEEVWDGSFTPAYYIGYPNWTSGFWETLGWYFNDLTACGSGSTCVRLRMHRSCVDYPQSCSTHSWVTYDGWTWSQEY